jgi:two-component system, LytTR family, response regulator LytT
MISPLPYQSITSMIMRTLIFEDEALTADRLIVLLKRYDPDIEILGILESVKSGIDWFKQNTKPDLIFMDIHLADGSCFEIFEKIKIDTPVIFTTAFDKYAIQAFKVNSIDYLLKPIDYHELSNAIAKYNNHKGEAQSDSEFYKNILNQIMKSYKQRFLVRIGDQMKYINTGDISYFVYDVDYVIAYTKDAKRFLLDDSIEKLGKLLNPADFFRINRKMLISLQSIAQIHKYFNSRLILKLNPDFQTDVIVSREKVPDFKKWLDK